MNDVLVLELYVLVQLRIQIQKLGIFLVGLESFAAEVKARLRRLGGRRVSLQDVLVIDAGRFRTQEANRRDALGRLAELVHAAAQKPKKRIATRPTRASKERRIAGKRTRSTLKRGRSRVADSD